MAVCLTRQNNLVKEINKQKQISPNYYRLITKIFGFLFLEF